MSGQEGKAIVAPAPFKPGRKRGIDQKDTSNSAKMNQTRFMLFAKPIITHPVKISRILGRRKNTIIFFAHPYA
jgi:hypothetical protein